MKYTRERLGEELWHIMHYKYLIAKFKLSSTVTVHPKGVATREREENVAQNASVCLKKQAFASKASVFLPIDPFASNSESFL